MEITILELIENYGFNSVLLAVILFVLTGLIKKPLKMLAGKTADSAKYTRFITFLPLILGFGITALYEYLVSKAISIDGGFVRLWITSSSLSLAIYAFAEKFIPDFIEVIPSPAKSPVDEKTWVGSAYEDIVRGEFRGMYYCSDIKGGYGWWSESRVFNGTEKK